ncbi:ArsR family transcriptional regulator [Actinoallomurus bryophytorum]|uniref:ArsR family transcriptional regulator n=1 Tax=Actinoallomurus bryophytorum TaxID=1490222 RepID=A0A543CSF2_9ACTN|nr:metalloregulator ArsR/SmtB family transcription factor [Actinoallomurus bryophytorum]TQL99930.1 ArsR family transcriptional regulator [Actinoallomurus bryophytorum]
MTGDDDAPVFRALADPTRRFLLDRLLARDGRTLGELESELEMSRFGVMKHLRILEEAGLVVSRRSGREKLHFLNPVPIRLIHDRWIGKYTEQRAAALAGLKARLERPGTTTQVFRVHLRAVPEAVWEAVTSPAWTARYGHRAPSEYDLRPGGAFRSPSTAGMRAMGMPEVVAEGEVLEADPPRRLVQTWRMLLEPGQAAEPYTRITWEIEPLAGNTSRLTVTHDLEGAPIHASMVSGERMEEGGGWPYILSDLKSLLETGAALMPEPEAAARSATPRIFREHGRS